MKIKIILLSLLLISLKIFSQSSLLQEGNIVQKTYSEVISFEIEKDKMIIPVEINGKNYRFMFDTGAPNVLNTNVFKDFSKIGSLNVSDSNDKKGSLFIVKVSRFKIGNLDFENFNFPQYDFSKNLAINCLNIDGIIGSNSFASSVVQIDYQQKKLYITNKINNIEVSAKPKKMKLLGRQKAPYFEIKLTGKNNKKGTEEVLFDSGYNGFYSQSNRSFAVFYKEQIPENIITGQSIGSIGLFGSDAVSEKSVFTIPGLNIGSASFQNITVFSSNDNNSKFGLELLMYGKIILDFVKRKFYFESFNENYDLMKPYPLFTSSYENGNIIIGMILDHELEKKISVGDIIFSVDGKQIEKENCNSIFNFKYPVENFEVINSGKKLKIELKDYR